MSQAFKAFKRRFQGRPPEPPPLGPSRPPYESGILYGALPISEPEAYREEVSRRRPIQLAQNTHQPTATDQTWAAGRPEPARQLKLTGETNGARIPGKEVSGQPTNPGIWGRLPQGALKTDGNDTYDPLNRGSGLSGREFLV